MVIIVFVFLFILCLMFFMFICRDLFLILVKMGNVLYWIMVLIEVI